MGERAIAFLNGRKDRYGQSITEMLSNSVKQLLGASPSTGNGTKSWDVSQLGSVWVGIDGIDGLSSAGCGIYIAYDKPPSWWIS
jgi:hypothetical protein